MEFGLVTPDAYAIAVAIAALSGTALCVLARRGPGQQRDIAGAFLGSILALDAASWVIGEIVGGTFSFKTSLPLALCNAAIVVAAFACVSRIQLLVELTYFIGLAGTLQAVATPDLSTGFPHLVFFQYLVGHCGIVIAAVFLVFGVGVHPRPGAVVRVFCIAGVYTAVVGLVDALSGANYMFLRRPPGNWTLLRLLGPWPWYVLSAAGLACALFLLLDLPFVIERRHAVNRCAEHDEAKQNGLRV